MKWWIASLALALACHRESAPRPPAAAPAPSAHPRSAAAPEPATSAEARPPASTAPPSRSPAPSTSASSQPASPPPLTPSDVAATLFGPRAGRNAPTPDAALVACANASDVATCLHERRFPGKVPRRYVTRIREASGWTLGLLPPRSMNGGWRGQLRLVPRLPLGPRAVHLRRMALAVEDFATFFRGLQAKAAKEGRRVDYRWRRLTIRFFESVGRGTPSAYARGWTVAYNVNGSLLRHDRGVRETLFHEIVHLNDAHHGGWSRRALRSLHADIVERCSRSGKLQNSCLKPYAPTDTKVRRYGIYYAFHPESGVGEYAAELATRYYTEHRARLAGRPVPRPFRCQTPENARAMALLVDEFFGGVDLTPPCP